MALPAAPARVIEEGYRLINSLRFWRFADHHGIQHGAGTCMDSVRADFAAADDLLQEAARSRLAGYGQILVEKAGRIGPLVELELASAQFQEQYREVSTNSTFSTSLRKSLQTGQPFGSAYNDSAGAFPLTADNPITAAGDMWDQWSIHAENIAKRQWLSPHVVP